MNTQLRTKFLSSVIFFVIIASAVFTVPARADSGSPPPAPTTPGGSSHGSTQVPSGGTNSTGGGDQGHKVELSSQNAAYIAPAGDPIWCPSGVAVPVPGASGCSANYANLYSLTNAVESGIIHPVLTNSNIWIQHGADSSPSTMLLNGLVLTSLSNFSLNFKGGWNGLGTGSVNPSTPSTFTKGLDVVNWNNNITLSDVQFNNVTGAAPSRGINITTKGNITLTRIQANNDDGAGAVLDNTSGNGSVTIANSQFNGDAIFYDLNSLAVYSNNAITLTSVFVNNGWGTAIDNSAGSNKPVTIKASYFDNNLNTAPNEDGLSVLSTGAITLNNVSATGNYGVGTVGGAYLDNSSSIFAAPVTLTGTNTFDSNADFGLLVYSNGKITAGSINANNNGTFGAQIDNTSAATALPLILTGSSTFNGNSGWGLNLFSQGAITANNLLVNGNGDYGAWLDNHHSFNSPLNVTGTNGFNSNHTWGVYIDSNGAISLNNITANGNGSSLIHVGLFAENNSASTPQKITLTGINNFNNNTGGAVLQASGPVSVSNVTAFGNTLSQGLVIQNHWLGSTMPQSVILLGHNLLSKNQIDNLDVETFGAITINGLTASDSVAGNGAWLGFSIPVPGNVTLNGINSFNNNAGLGLIIVSKGNVLTNGLNAISNGSTGVQIFNNSSTTPYPVTMKGINTFNFNSALGLQVNSNGAVSINSLSTVSNSSNGAQIVNSTSLLASPVTLTGFSNFNKNGSTGLVILSNGAVITNGLNALSNSSIGVEIINTSGSFSSPVTLKGLSTFNFNNSIGLELISGGTVITNGLNAQSNSSIGAEIINVSPSSNFPVTLNGVNTFNNNSSIGLEVLSNGAVVTSGLNAINNSSIGAEINNSSSTSASPVTLKGLSTFNLNSSIGLEVISNGVVLTNGLIALANSSDGAEIINSSASFTSPVTLKSVNFFEFNNSDGLFVGSNGAVGINGVNAIKNSSDGVFIDNASSITSAPVTLLGLSTFNLNGSDGLFVVSKGTVLTNGVVARNNNSDGVFIDNSGSGSSSPVTLKGLNSFSNNASDGLFVVSKGMVLTNNVNSINNTSDGVFIDNSASGISAPVTLNGVNTLNNNASDGLSVVSKGAITTNNLTAGFNGSAGVYMDNGAGAGAAINVKGKNITWDNGGDGMDLFSHGPVTVTNISSKLNSSDGLYVNASGFVTVSCGNLVSNGTSHITGYGWETGSLVTLIKLIGVTTAGNFTGDSHLNGATTVITVPHPCSLP